MSRKNLAGGICGLLFALGLGVGGMTNPHKIQAFLDVRGAWDPSLMFVMAGGIAVAFFGFRAAKRRAAPILGGAFAWPTQTRIDFRLVAGAAIFGVGWGLVGYCPGPALVALGGGRTDAAVVVASMLVGTLVARALGRRADELGAKKRAARLLPTS